MKEDFTTKRPEAGTSLAFPFRAVLVCLPFLTSSLGCGGSKDAMGTHGTTPSSSAGGTGGASGSGVTGGTSGTGGTGGTGGASCVPVDDKNPCTDDICENDKPVHKPVTGPSCDDGDACTGLVG